MEDRGGKSARCPGRHLQVEASGPGNAASVQQRLTGRFGEGGIWAAVHPSATRFPACRADVTVTQLDGPTCAGSSRANPCHGKMWTLDAFFCTRPHTEQRRSSHFRPASSRRRRAHAGRAAGGGDGRAAGGQNAPQQQPALGSGCSFEFRSSPFFASGSSFGKAAATPRKTCCTPMSALAEISKKRMPCSVA